LGGHSKARFIHPNEAEVSKVDYSSKAKSCNVRGVGTFCDTFSILGNLFLYNLKNLAGHFPRNQIPKFRPFQYRMGLSETNFGTSVKFPP
jgi:hypothetical protein